MLKQIKKNIKNYRKAKYQKVLFSKKEINLRDKVINHILKSDIITHSNNLNCQSCKFYSKNLNKKNFIIFYKKFNFRLQLKEKYCLLSYKKKSNKNACFKSFILFSEFLMKNKEINNIQKLNTILKINDLLIIRYLDNKHSNLVEKFKKTIEYEKKLMMKYL
jgi:hypothetical protein